MNATPPTDPFPEEPTDIDREVEEMRRFGIWPPVRGHCAIQGESPLDEVDYTFDWRQHVDGSISNFRVTRGVTRYPEPPPIPRWRRFLARLLLGDGWVYFRFTNHGHKQQLHYHE